MRTGGMTIGQEVDRPQQIANRASPRGHNGRHTQQEPPLKSGLRKRGSKREQERLRERRQSIHKYLRTLSSSGACGLYCIENVAKEDTSLFFARSKRAKVELRNC